ncbi:BofC C-terminal domain-containing protein [Pontibacillus halophilus]|nr:BofC C-terminal domain-containing protein [Pontibacillus halophilus]
MWVFLMLIGGWTVVASSGGEEGQDQKAWEREPLQIEVVLQRVYLDGQVTEERIVETIQAMEDFWALYEEWQVVDQTEGKVIFQKAIDDISDDLKERGYFGLNEKGELVLFDGRPQDNEVIKSFYQIDVGELESVQHEELLDGIKVNTKDRYMSLLRQFEQAAVHTHIAP